MQGTTSSHRPMSLGDPTIHAFRWKARGVLYLTSMRLVFVANKADQTGKCCPTDFVAGIAVELR